MYKNINVEAEHNELILENSNGDKVIIPANKRNWVKQKLSEGCHGCIDSLVETLPVVNNYAQDGTVFPNEKQPIVLITPSGRKVETDTDSDFYRAHYNSKLISKQNEDKSWNLTDEIYQGKPLPEVVVTSKIQPNTFADYNNQFNKNNPKDKFLQAKQEEHNKEFYSAPLWAQQAVGGYNDKRKQNDLNRDNEEYKKLQNDFIAEKLLKRTPFEGIDNRLKWMSKFSPKELETIKNSKYANEIEPSIWSKFEQGLLSVGNMGSPVQFKNPSLSQEEAKKEDNPLNILQPLNIAPKMVQSAYKDDYSFTDALKGKQNNAGIVEDIVTDPLNLIGLGIWGKLSKANRFKNLDEAYQSVKGLSKEEQLSRLNTLVKETPKNIDYNPSNNLILKSIEEGSPLEKSLSKNGEININTLQAHINNNATSKADKYILQKVVDSHFQNKTSINYNELKNKISDELVELNKTDLPLGNFENYGLDRIGFPNNTSASFTGKVPQHYQDIYNNINNSSTFYKGHDNKYWFDKLSMDKGFDTKEEAVKWLESQMAHNKQMNKTITFSNEEKFGRGSSDHFDENTLGHSRVFVSPEEPDVFHILESQSDFYQKSPLDKAQKNVKARQNILDEAINDVESKEIFGEDYDRLILDSHKMKLSEANYELKQAQKIMHDNPNPVQKILLGDKHQERLLQENLDYAAKNGQSKLRYPTPETAAKIQGYKKLQREVPIVRENELAPPPELIDMNTNTSYFNGDDYLPEHKTILKKYSEYPKMVKKTLGVDVKEVKDVKGNTWYELDIPKSFKDRKGKIKALSTLPLGIGLQEYLQNQNKSEQ